MLLYSITCRLFYRVLRRFGIHFGEKWTIIRFVYEHISFGLLYLYATIISKCCPVPRLIIWILRQVEAIRYKTIRSFGFFSPEFLIKCLNSLWSTRLRFDGLLVNFWFYRLFWQLFTQTHFYGSLKSRTIII